MFKDVSYNYGLNNVNYEFESSKITCVLGKSGSGKSMLGYIIMGLVNPTSGYITINGKKDYDLKKLRKEIGYVHQNPVQQLFCDTVYEEISFGLKQYRFKLSKIDEQVSKALKMVGLDDSYLELNPRNLSSGEIERIAIAVSLVLNPKVLILDEPTVFLDNDGINDLANLLKLLRDKYGKTIIVISNDMNSISCLCDNYLLLDNGKVANFGNSVDITNNSEIFEKCGMEVADIFKFVKLCNDMGFNIRSTGSIKSLVMDVVDNV